MTVSPLTAAFMADWIVGYSPGTSLSAAETKEQQRNDAVKIALKNPSLFTFPPFPKTLRIPRKGSLLNSIRHGLTRIYSANIKIWIPTSAGMTE